LIRRMLAGSLFAANVVYLERIDSTNRLAKELASSGAPEGTVVIAETQTSGRGRMGRQWVSPGYLNLLFSVIVRPECPPEDLFGLTMALALGATEAIRDQCGLVVKIKWPNDLYVGRKKLGGLLTEFALEERRAVYAVLGLGLNVNWSPQQEKEILQPATSIVDETGKRTPRGELLAMILRRFEILYQRLCSGGLEEVLRYRNEHCMILGRDVLIMGQGEILKGVAVRIDRDGALVIREEGGTEKRVVSGEVSLRLAAQLEQSAGGVS
jgi:BirA family transcriptional regulator, biotin operon repressor / biotin---[acetyl-CoA-carboxylase] ligase